MRPKACAAIRSSTPANLTRSTMAWRISGSAAAASALSSCKCSHSVSARGVGVQQRLQLFLDLRLQGPFDVRAQPGARHDQRDHGCNRSDPNVPPQPAARQRQPAAPAKGAAQLADRSQSLAGTRLGRVRQSILLVHPESESRGTSAVRATCRAAFRFSGALPGIVRTPNRQHHQRPAVKQHVDADEHADHPADRSPANRAGS